MAVSHYHDLIKMRVVVLLVFSRLSRPSAGFSALPQVRITPCAASIRNLACFARNETTNSQESDECWNPTSGGVHEAGSSPRARTVSRFSIPWRFDTSVRTTDEIGITALNDSANNVGDKPGGNANRPGFDLGQVAGIALALLLAKALLVDDDGGGVYYYSSESFTAVSTREADGSIKTNVDRTSSVRTNVPSLSSSQRDWQDEEPPISILPNIPRGLFGDMLLDE